MARKEEYIGRNMLEITEVFTHKQVLEDGTVLRWDGRDFWSKNDFSWYGQPLDTWDRSKAIEMPYVRSFTMEKYY